MSGLERSENGEDLESSDHENFMSPKTPKDYDDLTERVKEKLEGFYNAMPEMRDCSDEDRFIDGLDEFLNSILPMPVGEISTISDIEYMSEMHEIRDRTDAPPDEIATPRFENVFPTVRIMNVALQKLPNLRDEIPAFIDELIMTHSYDQRKKLRLELLLNSKFPIPHSMAGILAQFIGLMPRSYAESMVYQLEKGNESPSTVGFIKQLVHKYSDEFPQASPQQRMRVVGHKVRNVSFPWDGPAQSRLTLTTADDGEHEFRMTMVTMLQIMLDASSAMNKSRRVESLVDHADKLQDLVTQLNHIRGQLFDISSAGKEEG